MKSESRTHRARVESLAVGFDRSHLITLVKFRLHDLSTITHHWANAVAAHVHDHLLPGTDKITDRAIDLQPQITRDDWDMSKSVMPTGMLITEAQNGFLLTPSLAVPIGPADYFLAPQEAVMLKHHLTALRDLLPQTRPPYAGNIAVLPDSLRQKRG